MPTAFVLSGGGSHGAVQVGMLGALAEHGIRPDLLIGTSVGALNAAYVAAHGPGAADISRLEDVWRSIRRPQVFPLDPLRQALALAGRRPSLCSPTPLRGLIRRHLPVVDLSDAAMPVHVVATDADSGEEVLISDGDAVSAVQASASMPGVFPPVARAGRNLIDGGIANDTGLSHAVALGADRVVVLPAGYACALPSPPRTAVGAATHALTLLLHQRLVADVARLADAVELVVLPPLCPLSTSCLDFGSTDALIARSFRTSSAWLARGDHRLPHPERFLSVHSHLASADQQVRAAIPR